MSAQPSCLSHAPKWTSAARRDPRDREASRWRKDVAAHAYGGAAYAKGIRFAGVKKDDKSPAVQPSLETVRNGSYPITRFLYLYTRVKPSKDMKSFIDWATGPEGQAIVSQVGYFPIR